MRTSVPCFRVTRAISFRGRKIPIEAECSACSDERFKVRYDKREHFHEPNADANLHSLKLQFEAHVKLAHSSWK
jgi:hypothetical protein